MNTDLGPASSCEEVHFEIENDKEIALASAPALQPNFMSKSITKEQIAKLQALRCQRLQLKHTNVLTKNRVTQNKKNVNNRLSCSLNHANTSTPVMRHGGSEGLELNHQEDKPHLPRKRLQKLRWGLDVKERWERKGNM